MLNKLSLPVTALPLASVTGTATGVTVVTNCVTGFPLASVTGFPLASVTPTTDCVTGFPLESN